MRTDREKKLANGVVMPQIGVGTWQIQDRETIKDLVKNAYDIGYRLFDTAAAYSNERAIGRAVAELGLPREELFLTDKVWNTYRGYEKVREACKISLKKLKTDYLDLYLIHWPASLALYQDWAWMNAETWRGMESLCQEGVVRAIGVCNFKVRYLMELEKTATVMPMVNQVECHPGMFPGEVIDYCRGKGIVIEASSPLGNGKILCNEVLKNIAEEKERTVAQVCLRWGLQKRVAVVPKTTNIERLLENYDVFDFVLSDWEMSRIDDIPYCGGIGIDSEEVIEFG